MPWRPFALQMWLESWRLMRLLPVLHQCGVEVKEDLLELTEEGGDNQWPLLELRLLEERRWREGLNNLLSLVKSFNYLRQRKASIPCLDTWLKSLRLTRIQPTLEQYGCFELVDLDDITPAMRKELCLTKLQEKHWVAGLNQVHSLRVS
jgi:hypothetical protein